jgi:hypothetical protein
MEESLRYGLLSRSESLTAGGADMLANIAGHRPFGLPQDRLASMRGVAIALFGAGGWPVLAAWAGLLLTRARHIAFPVFVLIAAALVATSLRVVLDLPNTAAFWAMLAIVPLWALERTAGPLRGWVGPAQACLVALALLGTWSTELPGVHLTRIRDALEEIDRTDPDRRLPVVVFKTRSFLDLLLEYELCRDAGPSHTQFVCCRTLLRRTEAAGTEAEVAGRRLAYVSVPAADLPRAATIVAGSGFAGVPFWALADYGVPDLDTHDCTTHPVEGPWLARCEPRLPAPAAAVEPDPATGLQ